MIFFPSFVSSYSDSELNNDSRLFQNGKEDSESDDFPGATEDISRI